MSYRAYAFPSASVGNVTIMDGDKPADPFQVASLLDDLETSLGALTELEDLVKVLELIIELRTKRASDEHS